MPGIGHNSRNADSFEVRHYQAEFWGALTGTYPDGTPCVRRKRVIGICHRRWGKDEMALRATCIMLHKHVGSYWHCLPLFEQARKVVWDQVNIHTGKRRIDECFPEHLRESTNDTRMMIKFKNGSTWQLIGSDSYDKNVGAGTAGIVFSEWAMANPAAWAFFRPMLVESGGWAAFITTPRGENHAARMFYGAEDRMKREREAVKVVEEKSARRLTPEEIEDLAENEWYAERSTIYDTQALSLKEAEEALEEYSNIYGPEMGRLLFEQEYECSFRGILVGSYWGKFIAQAEEQGRVADFAIDWRLPVHTAWDLGDAENNPIWCFQVVDGRAHIVDFYKPHDDTDLEAWCRWLSDRGYHGRDFVPHDAAVSNWGSGGRTRMDMLKDMGRNPVMVKREKVAEGINAGTATIRTAKFRDTPRVQQGLDGLRNFRREWDEEVQRFKDKPLKDWAEHIASAFRYLALAWREMPEVKSVREGIVPRHEVFTADAHGRVQSNLTLEERCLRKCGMTPKRRRGPLTDAGAAR